MTNRNLKFASGAVSLTLVLAIAVYMLSNATPARDTVRVGSGGASTETTQSIPDAGVATIPSGAQIAPGVVVTNPRTPQAPGQTEPAIPNPAVATPTCPAPSQVPAMATLIITVGASSRFSQPCYEAIAGQPLTIQFTNNAVNSSTGLTPPLAFNIFPAPAPPTYLPNGVVQTPIPSPAAAILTSPTALSSQPLTVSVGPLPPGQYQLRLVPESLIPPALLNVA